MTINLTSLADLAVELEMAAIKAQAVAVREGLKAAADLIADDARNQIGYYQAQVGPYPAWAPLAQSTEEEKARLGAPANAPLYRFGNLQASFHSELLSDEEAIAGSIDPVMLYHEFGTYKMPPRPAVGPALFKNFANIQRILAQSLVNAVISGQSTVPNTQLIP